KARVVSPSAHSIITCTVAVAHDDGNLWHGAVRYSIHHLGPVLNDAALFAALADHKAGNILQKNDRNLLLIAVHDKSRRFIGRIRVDDSAYLHLSLPGFGYLALIGYNTHTPAIHPGKTGNKRLPVSLFILSERIFIHNAIQDVVHI